MTIANQNDSHSIQGWIADLSDGQTAIEGPTKPGDATAWQQLLKHCRENNIEITHLRLQRHNVTLHGMSPKMCDGYFQAYEVEQLVYRNIMVYKQGIGSVKDGLVYINWIARDVNPEIGMVYMWQESRPLDGCKVHTTLSEVTDDNRQ
jgi:hypothetical protein